MLRLPPVDRVSDAAERFGARLRRADMETFRDLFITGSADYIAKYGSTFVFVVDRAVVRYQLTPQEHATAHAIADSWDDQPPGARLALIALLCELHGSDLPGWPVLDVHKPRSG